MILDSFSLKGKVAWITGASYGIGFAIATAFHEAGAVRVHLVSGHACSHASGEAGQKSGLATGTRT